MEWSACLRSQHNSPFTFLFTNQSLLSRWAFTPLPHPRGQRWEIAVRNTMGGTSNLSPSSCGNTSDFIADSEVVLSCTTQGVKRPLWVSGWVGGGSWWWWWWRGEVRAVLRVRRDRKKGISSPQSCVRQLNTSNPRLQPLLLVVFTLVTAVWPGRVNRSASVLHSAEPLSAAAVTCETESLATLTPHSNCFFFSLLIGQLMHRYSVLYSLGLTLV